MLLKKNATVTICHSHTKNLKEIAKSADILVAALGHAEAVTADMVKPGAVVIDVGINRVNGKQWGTWTTALSPKQPAPLPPSPAAWEALPPPW